MSRRVIAGTMCRQCGQYTNILTGNIVGRHKTDEYHPFSNRRVSCAYGGGTVADMDAGITPLRRKTTDRLTDEGVTE